MKKQLITSNYFLLLHWGVSKLQCASRSRRKRAASKLVDTLILSRNQERGDISPQLFSEPKVLAEHFADGPSVQKQFLSNTLKRKSKNDEVNRD